MSKFTDFNNFSEYSDDSGKLLYVDILNFSEFFFPVREQWNVTAAYQYVKKFVSACKNSGWQITLFIGNTSPSSESLAVWRNRRAVEIEKGLKNMPMGLSILLGDMFKAEGVPIIYSEEGMSNHDMLAAYAEADGASILSDDKKYFSFLGSTFTVYGGYSIKNNELKLRRKYDAEVRNPADTRVIPAKRDSPPKCAPSDVCNGLCLRGTSTPLTKALGIDLQAMVTPLRLASHATHGVLGPLVEMWPYWDRGSHSVAWHEETVYPTASADMLELLSKPEVAVTRFFGRQLSANKPEEIKWHDWQKHLFCMRGIVYELCATEDNTLLSMWLKYESQHPVRAASAHKNARGGQQFAGRGSGQQNSKSASGYIRNPNISCYYYEERD